MDSIGGNYLPVSIVLLRGNFKPLLYVFVWGVANKYSTRIINRKDGKRFTDRGLIYFKLS